MTYDLDIEPEDLIPQYIETKTRLLELSRNRPSKAESEYNEETALLQAKLKKIESDVLFDRNTAEHEWKAKKSAVERDLAASRTAIKQERPLATSEPAEQSNSEEMGVNLEAERMAAEVLAEIEDEDMALDDLFDSLPQTEVDPTTGESQTVVTTSDGQRLTIKDFGTWSGVNPRRVLEEACRARDSGVRIKFRVVSQASFANRHSLDIIWAKPQELPQMPVLLDMEASVEPTVFTFTMNMVATPHMKQSEAYVSTAALFHIFGQNAREEKVYMKLPPIWRDFWSQLSNAKQSELNSRDREIMRGLRDIVRQRQDQELEDGVLLPNVFKGRQAGRSGDSSDSGLPSRPKAQRLSPDALKSIWQEKSSTPRFQAMIVRTSFWLSRRLC